MVNFTDDAIAYMREHNVAFIMEHILRNILRDLPPDPAAYIHDLMERPIPPQILLAGPPGSGRRSQCRALAEHFGVVHVSSGELLRAEVEAGSEAGILAESFLRAGTLVPNALITGMIRRRLEEKDAKTRGWILDGFPRSQEQAEAMEAEGIAPHVCIMLDLPDDIAYERIEHRRTDPATGLTYHLLYNPPPKDDVALCERLTQDENDRREVVQRRLKVYRNTAEGLLRHYGAILERVDASHDIDDVTKDVIAAVQKHLLQ
ncbi:adenylate kinase [Trypanosoma theileri]|uniref:Adenylate kinase n=1 Tax=Trypanosoma theileri TaxID=67003 RepID=A0A1X0NZB3_9TRYP|nr:adenylate kinase [Trypanosoma theileri]ORC89539.1 adenylate kinase [Trypanosoma theileri]